MKAKQNKLWSDFILMISWILPTILNLNQSNYILRSNKQMHQIFMEWWYQAIIYTGDTSFHWY